MKRIKERLDKGLVNGLEASKQMGLPLDLDKDLADGRKVLHQVAVSSIEMAAQITEVEKEQYDATYPDNSFNVPLFVYRPIDQTGQLPVIYWTHGGGLITGEVGQDEHMLKTFAKDFNCMIVAVEYRLAPEHPFPTPLEDIYLGLKWTFDNTDKLNIDPARVVIAGASAGGGLTAALAQLVRDRNEFSHPLAFQLLMYPMLDDRNTEPLQKAEQDTYIWTKANNIFGWSAYIGDRPGTESTPKYASASRMENLEGLPPTMIQVGGIDLFSNECMDYARRLNMAGVSTELHIYPGGTHGFEGLAPDIHISRQFIADRDSALHEVLHPA